MRKTIEHRSLTFNVTKELDYILVDHDRYEYFGQGRTLKKALRSLDTDIFMRGMFDENVATAYFEIHEESAAKSKRLKSRIKLMLRAENSVSFFEKIKYIIKYDVEIGVKALQHSVQKIIHKIPNA